MLLQLYIIFYWLLFRSHSRSWRWYQKIHRKQTQSCCVLKLCFKHGCSTALWISSLVFMANFHHLHILIPNLQLHDLFAWLISLNSKDRTLGASNCNSQYLWEVTPNQNLSQSSEAPRDLQHPNHRTTCNARSLSIPLTDVSKPGGGMGDTMPWIMP